MDIFRHESFDDHEQVVYCHDKATGLKAIIAIHNTQLGPALGGCRFYPYASMDEALTDVLRLSRGMTYKAAVTGLDLGGGKAVIIGDPKKIAHEGLFRTFGRFVNGLHGRYITAEDMGTNEDCMQWIHSETPHVTGVPKYFGGSGDPSSVTAHGVFKGIQASVKKAYGKDSLEGIKVSIQGVGHVGYYLCKKLFRHGVKLYVTDTNPEAIKRVVEDFNVEVVDLHTIYDLDVDVYAPCALGATINDETIPRLKCDIIAGAANNQLADEKKHGEELKKRGILYAPDYVINSGGLINVNSEIYGGGRRHVWAKTEGIYDTTLKIFHLAEEKNVSTIAAANELAERRIKEISLVHSIYSKD